MHFLERLRAANIERNKEWDTGLKPLSLIFFANELGGEVGEAQNILKKFDREFTYKIMGSRDTMDHLAEELADIIICADLLGMNADLIYTADQWPDTPNDYVVGKSHDYSLYGCMLNSMSGRIAGIAVHYATHFNKNILELNARALVLYTKRLADSLGLDLERLVCAKFNATSRKLGLSIMLEF